MANPRRAAFAAVAAAVVLWLWRRRPFRVAVEGHSMAPQLLPGDWLVAVRPAALRRGDLVVLEHPGRPRFEMVKRVTGLPGDQAGGGILGPVEYWVTGDDPDHSSDSRSFGAVPAGAIRGVVRLRYWPAGRIRAFGRGPAPPAPPR